MSVLAINIEEPRAKVAAWVAPKLSAALVLGLILILLLADHLPPFLAAPSHTAPVEVVRTVPVPYLEKGSHAQPAALPTKPRIINHAPAAILQVVARRSRDRRRSQRESESGALGKAGTSKQESSTGAQAKPVVWNLPHVAAPTYYHTINYTAFANKVKEKSGGRMEIRVHPASSLYPSHDVFVKRFTAAVDALEKSGYLLQPEAEEARQAARASSIAR